jgi:aarF domain-containing kinase
MDKSMHLKQQKELQKLLPKSLKSDPSGEKLAHYISEIDTNKMPVGSFHRLWVLGSMYAKVSAGYMVAWMRGQFAGDNKKIELQNEAHLKAAIKLLATMGYMRGAVMKVGQMLASLPRVAPEQFTEVLQGLHFSAPPMHYAMVREVFLDEFDKEPDQVFAYFDKKAFAAASLGQVHRARLHSGEEVAVKIQYPNIAHTIQSDMRNLRLFIQPMRFSDEWSELNEKLADMEQMFLAETDYIKEGINYQQARKLFLTDEQIVVPSVFSKFSSKRVLTTEYLPGVHLEQFLNAKPKQEEINKQCQLLTIAMLRLYYRKRWYFSDPHPGNYIFMTDGSLGIIDFGSIRAMTPTEWAINCDFEDAYINKDKEKMDQTIAIASRYTSKAEMPPEHHALLKKQFEWQMLAWHMEGEIDCGSQKAYPDGIDGFIELIQKGYTRGYSYGLWGSRMMLGLRAMTYKLKGCTQFKYIIEKEAASRS